MAHHRCEHLAVGVGAPLGGSVALVMIGSPLLGPSVWRPAAEALVRLGWDVRLLQHADRAPERPQDVLDDLLGQLQPGEATVLVAHSNAGLYLPVLAERLATAASVFVDASLPPAAGRAAMAPPAMRTHLMEVADENGLLPLWTDWWPEEVVEQLFPDGAARAAVETEERHLPLSYFAESLTVPDGWSTRPSAYLAFSEPYQGQLDQARDWGWPVIAHPGGHLQPLFTPEDVAAAIDELARRLGIQPGSRE